MTNYQNNAQTDVISDFKPEKAVRVEVSDNRMQAKIVIKPVLLSGHELGEQDLLEILKASKINNQRIDYIAVKNILQTLGMNLLDNNRKNIFIVAANGIPATKGIDGWKKFFHPVKKRVKIREDGFADFRNTDRYIHAQKNDKICAFFEGLPGLPGQDVFGNSVSPVPVKKSVIKPGKNINVKTVPYPGKSGLTLKLFISMVDGVLHLTESFAAVATELVFEGDVGLETGNVNYNGAVLVKGNVDPGSQLHCQGDLVVGGIVETDDLDVNGNLSVGGGIRTKGRNKIRVTGDVRAKFIENSIFEVDGDIVLEGAIVNSTIYCMGNIVLNGDNGNIIGSKIIAYGSVSVKNLGSSVENEVSVDIGFHFKNDNEYKMLTKDYEDLSSWLANEVHEINKIKQMIQRGRGILDESKKESFKKVILLFNDSLQKKKKLENEIEILKSKRFNSGEIQFVARSGAHPGTVVKYRSFIKKFTVFESAFILKFIPGQDEPVQKAFRNNNK